MKVEQLAVNPSGILAGDPEDVEGDLYYGSALKKLFSNVNPEASMGLPENYSTKLT